MEEKTIFHRILAKEVPADIVHEDDQVLAFRDIRPKAPTHILFVPKTFASSIIELTPETAGLPGMLILKAKEFAAAKGLNGYKLVFHVGKGGGQEVFYLHLHLLSQQELPKQ
jgi:histidine triad (HIT) family protein